MHASTEFSHGPFPTTTKSSWGGTRKLVLVEPTIDQAYGDFNAVITDVCIVVSDAASSETLEVSRPRTACMPPLHPDSCPLSLAS